MNKFPQSILLSSYLISLLTLAILTTPSSCKTTNNYLLNCGLTTTTIDNDNQTWTPDENPSFAPLSAYKAATTAATATNVDSSSKDQSPCKAARIFHAPFTYSFPVSPGPKFVRLHFCAIATYENTFGDQFFLSIEANGGDSSFTLLHNFSAYLHQKQFDKSFLGPTGKEFLIMATTSRLNLTFGPTVQGSLAFVNGIEIVDVPDNLYDYFSPNSAEFSETSSERSTPCYPPISVDNQHISFSILGPTALETVARLNVGGDDINPKDDYGGMFRTWYKDNNYVGNPSGFIFNPHYQNGLTINYTALVPNYTAPSAVYSTARVLGSYNNIYDNVTWSFLVDYGFSYLVRLHFCEIDSSINGQSQREFDVLINNQIAESDVDVMEIANGWAFPACKDYVTSMYVEGNQGARKAQLWLTLRPYTKDNPLYNSTILNGAEIFKMSGSNGSLAGPNPELPPQDPNPESSNIHNNGNSARKHVIEIVVGVIVSVVLMLLIIALALYWRMSNSTIEGSKRRLQSDGVDNSTKSNGSSSLPTHRCHQFTLQQIKASTENFDENLVIGVGGFGKVYKGHITIDGGMGVTVAIKRLNSSSKQGAHEFHTEIEMLTGLRHLNLVSLKGYCNENGEMILVYEYMPLGTLRDHLYRKTQKVNNISDNIHEYNPMPWKQRLMICIDAAKGLNYLHTGSKRVIIHRDVKSTNILLDENFTAKVSDFGISKAGSLVEDMGPNYISTKVKGSYGYLDPEYLRLNQLTEKTDVYSFGVVLFEVLCARPPIIPTLENKQANLATYAKSCYKKGSLHEIVDKNIRGEIAPECLKKFGDVAEMCVRDIGSERPTMGEVVWYLELARQFQETADQNKNISNSIIVNYYEDNNSSNDDELTTSKDILSSQSSYGNTISTKNSETLAIM